MMSFLRPGGLEPARLLCPWDSPGKNTGSGCRLLLQRIFPTQGSNLHLLHWQADSLPPSHLGRACRLLSSGEPWVGSEPWRPRRKQGPGDGSQPLPPRGPQPARTTLPTPGGCFLTTSWVLALLPERSWCRDVLLLLRLASDSAQDRALLEADAAHVQGLRRGRDGVSQRG